MTVPESLPGKEAPQAIRAERALLGALLLDPRVWERIADQVAAQDFYQREHQLLFQTIQQLADRSKAFDAITLVEHLKRQGQLDAIGGLAYLETLIDQAGATANSEAYAELVRERSMLRQLIEAGGQIRALGYRYQEQPVSALLHEAERTVFQISEQRAGKGGFQPLDRLLSRAIDRIETCYQQGGAITGVPSGFQDLDQMTAGFQNSDLIIVAGRPAMGKTSFALEIANHVALTAKRPVAFFSLEMPGDSLAMRLLSSFGRIDQHRLRTGQLKEEEWPRLTQALNRLQQAPLHMDDGSSLSPTELHARARRFKREQGDLALIVIDYLQLMQVSGNRENRTAEISEISRALKLLARDLQVPVIALSQLNRSLESRTNRRPLMSDLRESGSIEQDADLILFIYRDEVYHEDTKDKGIAEIIIAKHRNGPIGTVKLTFLNQFTKFENYIADPYQDAES